MSAGTKGREEIKIFSESLMKIHRILMEDEFARLEQAGGKIPPVTRLQMLLNGPELAWLRPLSQLMARVDEVLFQKEPIEQAQFAEVLRELREFFILESSKIFSDKLQEHCRTSTVLSHEVVRLKTLIIS